MGFSELIQNRQSIRSYIERPISRDVLRECVEAARLAPSACNYQPWRFICVDDRKLITDITDQVCGGIYSINAFVKNAGALVVVVSDKEGFLRQLGGKLKRTDYYLVDIGIACEHLVLKATELGLGSCWIGWFNERRLKQLLHVPRTRRIDIMISLGYYDPATKPAPRSRKDLSEIISFNTYRT